MVVYWGQNGYGSRHPDPTTWEKSLAATCQENPQYDAIALSFAISFLRTRNGNPNLPELNFAFHCDTPFDAQNPFLLRCDQIAADIKTCQSLGKKVLISLGGASGAYSFVSDAEGAAFAQTAWDIFLGGSSQYRPFGNSTLDGVDLDIEGGSWLGYSAFVKTIRSLMEASAPGKYIISGAPQCPYPDAYLGPGVGKALGDVANLFDYVNVQFYNNFCGAGFGAAFQDSWAQWAALSNQSGLKILLGLPATPESGSGYVDRSQLAAVINSIQGQSAFGGLMLWDASFDQNSVVNGQKYSAYAKSLLNAFVE
jgi:chitinase